VSYDPAKVAAALTKVESGGALLREGDSGRALGQLQFHPEAFWDWAPEPRGGETWVSWFERAAINFLDTWQREFAGTAEEAAVVYHRHCALVRASAADYAADDYRERFERAYAALVPKPAS
jgi:hypothetical protein